MDLTDRQQDAITTLDTDVCVTAGAGSGKTLVLALRYIEILRRVKAEVSDIVAVTFTEKAAREMRERIREYSDNEIRLSAGKPDLLVKWRKHKQDLEGARISTIHSLCSRILRENPAEARVDPEFTVIDENSATILASQVVDDAVEALLSAGDEHLRRIIEEYGVRGAKSFLRQLMGRLDNVERARTFHEGRNVSALLETYRNRLAEAQAALAGDLRLQPAWREAMAVLARASCTSRQDKLRAARELALEADRASDAESAGALRKMLDIKLNTGSAKNWDDIAAVKVALETLRDIVKKQKDFLLAEITGEDAKGIGLAADFLAAHDAVSKHYDDAKNEAGVLTFEDLEIKTRDLLKDNAAVRRELQGGMRFILVDEFQDVNPIQQEIILWLAGKAEHGKAGRPNLFFVGDDKQSIYRFRGADVAVFTRTRVEAAKDGKEISLDKNFRTVSDGVDFANALFGDLMRRDLATKSYQAIYEDIKAWREPLRKGPFAELNILRYDAQEKPGADELRLCEARAVAKTILQLTSSGERLVYDEKEKKWTTPRFRHIAIICRQLKGLAYAYERAFQEAGIPYHVTAGSDFYSRQEVLDVLNMLRVLDNSGDDYALAGALRSPMFAMSDEALYWISALEGDSFSAKFRSGAEHAKMAKEEKEKLARAREVGALLRSLKDRVSLPELINRILEMTGLEAVLATTFNGTRKIANLRKLVEVARSFEASRIFSLRDFITYVNEFLTEEMRESQAPIEEEEQDVVRILTIHKAKGLEFPLVIVPDICPKTEKKPGRGNIGLSGDLGLVVKLRQHPGKDEPPNGIFELFEHEEDSKELAESKRLLYVAATRAKDALIFSACLENGGQPKRWLGDISKSLGLNLSPDKGKSGERIAIHNLDCREFERPLTFSRRSEKKIQSIIRIVETAGSAKRPQASAAAPLTGPIATSLAAKRSFNPTELVEYEFCPRKYYHHFVCGHPQILAAPRKESIVPALTIGDISHRLFEMLHPGDRDKQIADAISAEGQFTDAQKEKLAETMRDFLEKFDSAPLAAELAGARESWEEVSFAAKCGDAAIEGKMDKVFRDARGALHIVDYKSDLVPDGKFQEKLDRYRLQLAAYGIGLKAATGETPASVRLYFFRYGETATLPMSEKKLDGLRSEIMRVIADIRANRFDRTAAAPCACGFEWLCGKESKQERIAK